MSDIKGLIARLEIADRPDARLDRAIALAVDTFQPPDRGSPVGNWLAYTASVDAALTLVTPLCWARVQTATRDAIPMAWVTNEKDEHCYEGYGATPAVALCIAALKARAALPSPTSS